MEGKRWREKYLRSRRTQNLLRFLDVAGKRRFPRSKLGKAEILQLAGEKKGTILDFSIVACSKSSRFFAYYVFPSNAQNTWDFC